MFTVSPFLWTQPLGRVLFELHFWGNPCSAHSAAGAVVHVIVDLMVGVHWLRLIFTSCCCAWVSGWEPQVEGRSLSSGLIYKSFFILIIETAGCLHIHPILLDVALVFVPPAWGLTEDGGVERSKPMRTP